MRLRPLPALALLAGLAAAAPAPAAVATPLRYTSAAEGRPASADLRVDGWLTVRIRCERPGRLQVAYFSQELDLLPAAARAQPLQLLLDGAETPVAASVDPVGLVGGLDLTPALAQQIAGAKEAAFRAPGAPRPLAGGDAGPLRRVARDCAR
jgi:hypothetical protein